MLPVEILPVQETIVLRARGSELLILPHHVKKLKGLSKPRDFSQYFRAEALVNRPARKLFEAWLRKDHTLWPRLYQTVHKEISFAPEEKESDPSPQVLTTPQDAGGSPTQAKASEKKETEETTPEVQLETKSPSKPAKKAKSSDNVVDQEAEPKKSSPKKSTKKAVKDTGEEPVKKEKKTVKKAAPKDKESTAAKKKETSSTKSKTKSSASEKAKSKKGS